MAKFNMADARNKAEAKGVLGSGGYLKLTEGSNKIRLMSECLEHPGEYNGKPTFKWLCYVIDRKDGNIKPYFMPHSIYKQIEALQLNPDYQFEEVPMPYDITLNAKGAGTKEVVYTVIPARTNSALTPDELKKWSTTESIRNLQSKLNAEDKGDVSVTSDPQERPPFPDIQIDGDDMP